MHRHGHHRHSQSPFDFFFNQGHHPQATPIWSEHSVVLTDHNFNHYVEGGGIWLFEFYSDGCQPCHEFSPTWDRLAKNLEGIVRMGRVDTDGGFRGERRTVGLVNQFRRMINGLPTVIGYDGNQYRSFYGHMEYEELVRFATERIPNHITRVSHGQGIRFLQHKLRGQDTEQPSVLLLSGHHRVSLLYRHVAFE